MNAYNPFYADEIRQEKLQEAYAHGFDNLDDYWNYLADIADNEYKSIVENLET
jgi:hypothetical protein